MALSIYVGAPGSGKTYLAIESIAIPAAKAGRTIITNISGIDPLVWSNQLKVDPDQIIVVDNEFFKDENNYPIMSDEGDGEETIPRGSLVLIDEAYTVFPTDKSAVTSRMIEWVRTHRHFVAPDGTATDLILVSQDVMSIHPRVRAVAEYVSVVRNMRHVGLGKRFRVDTYSSWRINKGCHLGQSFNKYDAKIFKLYKSFQFEGAGKVVLTDKRNKAVKWYHWFFLVGIFAMFGLAVRNLPEARASLSASEKPKPAPAAPVAITGNKSALPCSAAGGVMFDLDNGKAWHDGSWKAVEIKQDGTWVVDDVCSFKPGR